MRHPTHPLLPLLLVGLAAPTLAAQAPAEQAQPHAGIAGVAAAIDSYVAAFNRGDAGAVAGHWTEQGELATTAGAVLRGRRQIEDGFAEFFSASGGAKLELVDKQVTFLSPSVASETGIARTVVAGQPPSETSYQAVHVRTPDGWKLDRVAEQASPGQPPSHHAELQPLAWMVGQWSNADGGAEVAVSCRWTTNQNFLVRTFRVTGGGDADLEGTQVIGWDPRAGAIRSWVFDSDGGFGVGRWSERGDGWSVQTLNVLPDGRTGSSTNVYELVDDNTVRFRSVGRQVDGELIPSVGPVSLVRRQAE